MSKNEFGGHEDFSADDESTQAPASVGTWKDLSHHLLIPPVAPPSASIAKLRLLSAFSQRVGTIREILQIHFPSGLLTGVASQDHLRHQYPKTLNSLPWVARNTSRVISHRSRFSVTPWPSPNSTFILDCHTRFEFPAPFSDTSPFLTTLYRGIVTILRVPEYSTTQPGEISENSKRCTQVREIFILSFTILNDHEIRTRPYGKSAIEIIFASGTYF